MTLIELLLAIAVAVLVLSVVLAVYHTVTLTVTSRQTRRESDEAAALGLENMARDLTCTFVNPEDPHCFFSLQPTEDQSAMPMLTFCTAIPPHERDLRWSRLEQVTYRLGESAKENTRDLLRISAPIVGPGAFSGAMTNVIAKGITKMKIEVYDGESWDTEWARSSSAPEAARITLSTKAKTRHVEAMIPVGIVITSAVTRASVVP